MRIAFHLFATLVFFSPSTVLAQYDFDDFLQAVESGKAKAGPPVRLAQRDEALLASPSDDSSLNSEVPSIMNSREVPSTSILSDPTSGLKNNSSDSPIPENLLPPTGQAAPMPLAMIEESEVGSDVVGSSVGETPMNVNQTPSSGNDTAVPGQLDFQSLLSHPEASCDYDSTAPMGSNCAACRGAHTNKASCTVMPYRQPLLPAPTSLRGYFNASPCLAHVWDDYACEAAAACAKLQRNHGQCGCPSGEQVYEFCGSGHLGCKDKDCD